jgi:hypothetical protein
MTPPAPIIEHIRAGKTDLVPGPFLAMDESAGAVGEMISVGLLASGSDLASASETALAKLQALVEADPNSTASSRARKTVERGWFHASKDAHLAWSCYADALSEVGPLDLHVAKCTLAEPGLRKALFKALSLNALSLASLIDNAQCEIRVPEGPIANTQDGLDELFDAGADGFAQMHANPPRMGSRQKQELLDAAISTEPNYGKFRAQLFPASDSLVQAVDFLLWLFGTGKADSAKARLQRKFRPRRAPDFEHEGISVDWWKLGR